MNATWATINRRSFASAWAPGALVLGLAVGWFQVTGSAEPRRRAGVTPRMTIADEVYANFNAFCVKNFGAEKEMLAYDKFGDRLKFVKDGFWVHVSGDSACFAFETNLPGESYVEYGLTSSLGQCSTAPERAFYLHLHYLRDLQPGQKYYYRLGAVDERGNRATSKLGTFRAKGIAGSIPVPGMLGPPPYLLDQPGATYSLQRDIISDSTAFNVAAPNITLDLNGHTIVYNNRRGAEDPTPERKTKDFNLDMAKGVQAVLVGYRGKTFTLLNGHIKQGAGGDGSYRHRPVHLVHAAEMAGITIEYYGSQITGAFCSAKDVHHNVVLDKGHELTNRHQGVQPFMGYYGKLHHNLIKRTRHRGIFGCNNSAIFHNEIYIDSCATNSSGIFYYKTRNCKAYGNRIFGTGYHAVGISTLSHGVGDIEIRDNFIHMVSGNADTRWTEYGAQSGVNGLRVTWGGDNIEWHDNIVVVEGRGSAKGEVRGVWHVPRPGQVNLVYHDNVFKATAARSKKSALGAVVICGGRSPESDAHAVFRHNTLISDFCNVSLGGLYYGAANNGRFENNRFVRCGDRSDYRTVQCGAGRGVNKGHVFIDSVCENGANLARVLWRGDGQHCGFSVGWTLTVHTGSPGAHVEIADRAGKNVYRGVADSNGETSVPVIEALFTPRARLEFSPHLVTVENNGLRATVSVTMDRKRTVNAELVKGGG